MCTQYLSTQTLYSTYSYETPGEAYSQVSYVSLQCSTCKQFGMTYPLPKTPLTNTFTAYANLAYTYFYEHIYNVFVCGVCVCVGVGEGYVRD